MEDNGAGVFATNLNAKEPLPVSSSTSTSTSSIPIAAPEKNEISNAQFKTSQKKEHKERDITAKKDGGILKKVLKKGVGKEKPFEGFVVSIHYVGKFVDGKIFDSSREKGEVFSFRLGQKHVIPGWEQGILTMHKGEIAFFKIQPEYAYKNAASPSTTIRVDEPLEFEIELIDWEAEMDITDPKDGGVIHKVIKEGTGIPTPHDDSWVLVNYIGYREDNTVFEKRENFKFIIKANEEGITRGLDLAVFHMRQTEKALFTIAPSYAFGEKGNKELKIGPDETIKYEIELLDFEKDPPKWRMSRPEKKEAAIQLRNEGNELYKQNNCERAIKRYDKALAIFEYEENLNQDEAFSVRLPCYLNICACYLKMKQWKQVVEFATKAVDIDPSNVKALFRRAKAFHELGEWERAKSELEKILELEPEDKEVRRELQLVKSDIHRQDKRDSKKFSGMFDKMTEEDEEDEEEEKAESPFYRRFIEGMFKPGASAEHLKLLNMIFIGLAVFILFLAIILGFDVDLTVVGFLILTLGLFAAIHWYIATLMDASTTPTDEIDSNKKRQ